LPYDSEAGRDLCSAITALMTGEAYAQSACIAERIGPFDGYLPNRESMLEVIQRHRGSVRLIDEANVAESLLKAARQAWENALRFGEQFGYRNSQVSVLAPTGTIGFMMDCDTTGIEPDLALVKRKRLVGGGVINIINGAVGGALARLGYTTEDVARMQEFIVANGTIEGAPVLRVEHLAVFDCSIPTTGGRSISWQGHLRMMAAAQPFLSGAISKTINMPEESTAEDIAAAYVSAWKLGLKAVAIYRNNSKGSQPLSAAGKRPDPQQQGREPETNRGVGDDEQRKQQELFGQVKRRKLPDERSSITHKFSIAGHKGYLTVGKYENGELGEIFIKMAKEGSTLSGIMDAFAQAVSLALQYGVPPQALVDKFVGSRFEPSGFTGNPTIRLAKSLVDYIGRWLGGKFISHRYFDSDDVGAPGASGAVVEVGSSASDESSAEAID